MEGAQVSLNDVFLGRTDSAGVFYSEPVEAGYHLLQIQKEGYRSVLDTIFVPEGLTYNHTAALQALRLVMINELTGLEADSVGGPYTIQVGAFRSVDNARRLAAAIEKRLSD